MAHNWVKIKSGLITFLFSQMRVFPSLSVTRSQVGIAVAIFLAAFSSSSVVYSMDPSSVAGKILFYDGERNSEASLEIRVSSDGRTYQATMRSGKYVYKCEKSNLLPNGFLDFAECGDMDDLDPNREGRNPLLYVEGELEVPVSRTRSVHGYGLQLEFSLNKDKTMMATRAPVPIPDFFFAGRPERLLTGCPEDEGFT